MLRQTVAASVVLAAFAIVSGILFDQMSLGIGLAAGLILGSFNGPAIASLMSRSVPFVGGSVLRMALFSAAGILVALLVGAALWAVLLGVAGAQVVMVVAAVRQGLRA